MPTYTINTDGTPESQPNKLEQIKGNVIGFGVKAAQFLLLAIFLLAEFFSVPKLSNTQASQSDIRQEMDELIQSGYSRELEFDLDIDLDLYDTMMTIVRTMKYGDFKLEGSKAQEFWKAYAPAKSDTTLEYIRFDSDAQRVLLRYSNGIAADVTMEFDTSYLYKATILRYGVFNGSIIRWLYWNLIGRFVNGYPCYVTEASLSGNGIRGDVSLKKYTIRNQIFSWSFHPGKRTQLENISDHWA